MMKTSDALYLQMAISPVSECQGNAAIERHAGRDSGDQSMEREREREGGRGRKEERL